ncbi:sugar ABC transporter permease [Paeniglutamicibacter psychrophenolicus]|uniref:Multiple sugar transport system permease protein n=1 Tax=Paeniglutamicibacter psychrophenolicus TaxID=257454 RepID=A0ABS4WCG7_9MICC|nr:sugar ABC transporter permease [Paeniglutamicibacter psychrophenolicus]MBP2373902.1 multiple sugar transport system permease protein [Paeniglutamicibacter psychrophenolicus]
MSVGTPTRSTIPKTRTSGRQARTAALLLAPFAVIFLGMYLAPLCFAVYRSLFVLKRDGLGLTAPTLVFDPFTNYLKAFTDPVFIESLGRVLLFGVVQVPVMLALATGLALLIDSRSARAKGFFRLTSFLPYAVPGVIAALMWSFLYSGTSSPINALLAPLGIEIPFLGQDMVLWSVANIVTWGWTGYNMIIIYAALQSIPGEILEAAKIDGASAWNIAWNIKIPMVRPALILTAVFSIIGTAQLYNEPKVLQSVSGGSIDSAFTPIMAAQAATAAQNYPYAAATSVILAVLVGILSITFFKITNRGSDA